MKLSCTLIVTLFTSTALAGVVFDETPSMQPEPDQTPSISLPPMGSGLMVPGQFPAGGLGYGMPGGPLPMGNGIISPTKKLVPLKYGNSNKETSEDKGSTDKRLGTGGLVAASEWLRKNLPDSQYKCAAESYLSALGMDKYSAGSSVGSSNEGLNSHFQTQVTKNICFAEVAETFFEDLNKEDQAFLKSIKLNSIKKTKPSLTDAAGKGIYEQYPEGWLWEKALKATGGNPNAAMTLIGMCGHDDIGDGFSFTLSLVGEALEQWKTERRAIISKLSHELEELRKKTAGMPTGPESEFLSNQLEQRSLTISDLRRELDYPPKTLPKRVNCPAGISPMFAPRSVASEMDLPQELKESIAAVQRGNADASTLPAKAYHFMGSAYMGCQLAKCGISPNLAVQVQKTFASGYRALRLCNTVRENLKELSQLESIFDLSANDPKFQPELRKAMSSAMANKDRRCGTTLERATSPIEAARSLICRKNSLLFSKTDPEKRIDRVLDDYDASRLYRNWYLGGGSVGGIGLPCTDIRLGGPENLTESDYFENRPKELSRPPGSMCGIPGWSSERCAKARAKLATWDVDFDWTKKQHEIGAKFGATHCRKQDINEPLDKRMCSVLEQNGKGSSTGQADPAPKAEGSDLVQ